MSRLAAMAMRDLADCLRDEAEVLPPGIAKATLFAMARAHYTAAGRIEQRVADGNAKLPIPPEFQAGQAGTRKGDR